MVADGRANGIREIGGSIELDLRLANGKLVKGKVWTEYGALEKIIRN
jgi:hypothetical protein